MAVVGVGSNPSWVTCGTSQVLLRVFWCFFPWSLPFLLHLQIGSSGYERNDIERDVKRNKKWKEKNDVQI